jgi:hypothetical protein
LPSSCSSALLLAAIEPEKSAASAARLFWPIGCRSVRSLARLFVVQTVDAQIDAEQFAVMRERLRKTGYRLLEPKESGYTRLQQLREDYWPELASFCRQLHILLPEPLLQGHQPKIARPKRES